MYAAQKYLSGIVDLTKSRSQHVKQNKPQDDSVDIYNTPLASNIKTTTSMNAR